MSQGCSDPACVPQVLYKEELGTGTPTPVTPEMERVKRNQEQISSVFPPCRIYSNRLLL